MFVFPEEFLYFLPTSKSMQVKARQGPSRPVRATQPIGGGPAEVRRGELESTAAVWTQPIGGGRVKIEAHTYRAILT